MPGRVGPAASASACVDAQVVPNEACVIVGMFVVCWAAAIIYWRIAGVEDNWNAHEHEGEVALSG
jgi:hypothetical protein